MTTLRALALGAALVAGTAFGASAADLGGRGGSIKDGYVPAPMAAPSSPSSWYVRGDVGHARFDRPTIIEGDRFEFINPNIDDQWSGGLGVGYYFSRSVRADLTWDHRFETDVTGSVAAGTVNFPGNQRFGLKSDVFLANLYYDFDNRSRFTPYIGMGIGFTVNKTTGGTVVDPCAVPCFTDGRIAGDSHRHIAGALMTGFSYNVRDRLHFDAGYRFLYLGEARTGLITGTPVGPPAPPVTDPDPRVTDIYAHEFRVGLRLDIK